ncbi:DUF6440 family protein [Enterococcus rivorum]|uniref:DUF6440 family protein n=2 Tax=Enterococcus rivorum TaxID=762845 RepID=UPI001B80C69F
MIITGYYLYLSEKLLLQKLCLNHTRILHSLMAIEYGVFIRQGEYVINKNHKKSVKRRRIMDKKRFDIESTQLKFGVEVMILTDKVTGVQYLYLRNGTGGGITPLLDSNGQPVIKK